MDLPSPLRAPPQAQHSPEPSAAAGDSPGEELDETMAALSQPGEAAQNVDRVKQVLEYQFDLEVICKKRELLLIDSRIRSAETMLKQIAEGVPSHASPAAAEKDESDAMAMDGDDHKNNASLPFLYARRKDGQYVRVRCPSCGRERFATKLGFLNHCRLQHQARYVSADAAILACGKPIPESEVPLDDPCRQEALPPPKKRNFTAIDRGKLDEDVSRFHITKRLIVGNTCEKLPPAEPRKDGRPTETHRWMVYVRPPPDDPTMDLSFIKKVCFLLHEDFKPDDRVEVFQPPFQITRRGWGEFPVRLQFHFHNPERNRPHDVLHHLKLHADAAPGFQAMGAETHVELLLDRRAFEQEISDDRAKLRRVTNRAELTEKEVSEVMALLQEEAQVYYLIDRPGKTRHELVLPYLTATSEAEWDSWNIGRQRASEWQRARRLREVIEQRLGLSLPTKTILQYTIACGLSPRPPPAPLVDEPAKKATPVRPTALRKAPAVMLPPLAPKSAIQFLASLEQPLTRSKEKLDDCSFCKYCGSKHTPQASFANLQTNCGRIHNINNLCTHTIFPLLRRPIPLSPLLKKPPAATSTPTPPPAAVATPAAPSAASVSSAAAAAAAMSPNAAASGLLLPEVKLRDASANVHLKSVDLKTAAAEATTVLRAILKRREANQTDELMGALFMTFMRRLLRASVAIHRKQQASETLEETKHKILVPLHVYEAILASPALFDVITNAGLGKH